MKTNMLRIKLGWSLQKYSRRSGQGLWADVAEKVLASRKNRPSVNVSEISRNAGDGAKVVVAGKVLGAGSIDHKVIVGAYSFSASAKAKIVAAGGKCVELEELMKSSKNVKDVLIIG